jgi:hypothetical protein
MSGPPPDGPPSGGPPPGPPPGWGPPDPPRPPMPMPPGPPGPPPRRHRLARSSVGLGLAGVLLIVGGIVFGLWAWVFTEPASAVSADCELLEDEAPRFGEELQKAQLAAGDLNKMADWIEDAGDHFIDIGERLEDEELSQAMVDGGEAAQDGVERLRQGDLTGGIATLPPLMTLVQKAYNFLNDNCANWKGPGQWTSPGETAPTGGPSDLPSMPSPPSFSIPSLPSFSIPSLPSFSMPSLPSFSMPAPPQN